MKRNKYRLVVLLISFLLLGNCSKKEEEFTICATNCPAAAPWTVESLDMGLPCFATRDECTQWAGTHGYSGKPCVKCN